MMLFFLITIKKLLYIINTRRKMTFDDLTIHRVVDICTWIFVFTHSCKVPALLVVCDMIYIPNWTCQLWVISTMYDSIFEKKDIRSRGENGQIDERS